MAYVAAVFVLSCLFGTQHVQGVQLAVTPVEKVITLLKSLKAEIVNEGKTEATSYDAFACFCKDLNDKKSKSITSARDNIDSLSADIEAKTAQQAEDEAELQERKVKHEEKTKELAATKDEYAKEKAAYVALAADLSKAISSLGSAIGSLEAAKSFLEVRSQLENTLSLADALSLKVSVPKNQAVMAFLQQTGGATVDPLDPTYKYRSGGIIKTLEDLQIEFRQKKKDVDDEWAKAEKVFKKTIKALEDFLGANQKAMDALEKNILKLKGEIAQHRIDLVNEEAGLKDDQLYLKDLTTRCEARANDWDQRTQLRADELTAIEGALTILRDDVKPADELVNERAMLQTSLSQAAPVSFLQAARVDHGVQARTQQKLSTQARQDMVATLLGGEARRLGSMALTSLSMRIAGDPFTKIKKLIQDLIERLLDEATAEATKKGFCDQSLGEARKDRDYRLADANSLNNELEQLEIKQDELEEEISVLTADIDLLKRTLANATQERKDEHDDNMQTIATADEGLKAVNEATEILRAFYKDAAKVEVFLQASPVDEDTDGAGFSGNYGGKRKASKGIIGMLEVIISDFERTLRVTKAAEAKAHADFVLFDRASKADISGKEMKKELDEEDLKTTIARIAQKMNDLQTAMDRLDAALKKIEALKPTCIDTGMSYEERVSKRDEEIAALKKALCILDEDGAEPSCPGGR